MTAGLAQAFRPNFTYNSLHLVLATEGAAVLAVLGDLHLLDRLPQAGTITGSILAGDSDLLSPLGHRGSQALLLKYGHRLGLVVITLHTAEFLIKQLKNTVSVKVRSSSTPCGCVRSEQETDPEAGRRCPVTCLEDTALYSSTQKLT